MTYNVSWSFTSDGPLSYTISMNRSSDVEWFVNAPINHDVWITVQTIKWDDRFYDMWQEDKRRW